jgi:gamma-glutamylcyclotransferase (GGCT)/AIG2-like uncharacterized protein YtfP
VWNYYSSKRGGGAANVERDPEGCVYGVAFAVDSRLLNLFDCKEGYPAHYRREEATVEILDLEEQVKAWVYVAVDTKPGLIPPTSEYKAIVVEGARCWKLPGEWISLLEGTPVQQGSI